MLRNMLIPFVCTLAVIVSSCGPAGTTTPTGTVNVTVAVDKTANTTAADPSINVTITNASGVVGDAITAPVSAQARTLNEGTYTVVAGTSSGYTVNITPSANLVVSASAPVSVTVTYVAQGVTTGGAVTPAKTFTVNATSSFGIGSLAFIPGAGAGAGRLYASGSAVNPGDISGRLYLDPASASATLPAPAVPPSPVSNQNNIYRIAFNSSGALYDLERVTLFSNPPTNTIPSTVIKRYTRTTAASNLFSPVELTISTGAYSGGTFYSLLAPTDIAVDSSGNLWVVDPNSTARSEDGLGSGVPNGRLLCYSATDQTNAVGGGGNIGTPGANYYGSAIAGARTLAFDGSGNLWIGAGTGSSARLTRIQVSSLRSGNVCPNYNSTLGRPENTLVNLPASNTAAITNFTGASLVGPVDLAVSGTNLLIAQFNGSTNNIITMPLTAAALPTTTPTTITGLVGNISSIAVNPADSKTWVGTAGATAGVAGRIYQLP